MTVAALMSVLWAAAFALIGAGVGLAIASRQPSSRLLGVLAAQVGAILAVAAAGLRFEGGAVVVAGEAQTAMALAAALSPGCAVVGAALVMRLRESHGATDLAAIGATEDAQESAAP